MLINALWTAAYVLLVLAFMAAFVTIAGLATVWIVKAMAFISYYLKALFR